MTDQGPGLATRETGRAWLVRPRQKEFRKKNSSDDIRLGNCHTSEGIDRSP